MGWGRGKGRGGSGPTRGGVHTLTLPCRPPAARSPRCRRSRAGCGPPRCPSVPWGGGEGKGGAEVDPLGAASTHSLCRVALLPLARFDVDVVGRAVGRLGARLSRRGLQRGDAPVELVGGALSDAAPRRGGTLRAAGLERALPHRSVRHRYRLRDRPRPG